MEEEVSRVVYDSKSYSFFYDGRSKTRKLTVQTVQVDDSQQYVILTATDSFCFRSSSISLDTIRVLFLGVRVTPVSIRYEATSKLLSCSLVFDSVLYIMLHQPELWCKSIPSSATLSKRGNAVGQNITASAAADGILILVSEIEREQSQRRKEIERLDELREQQEEQEKVVTIQKRGAIQKQQDLLRSIIKHMQLVYEAEVRKISEERVRKHVDYIYDSIDVMLVPMYSTQLRSKYGDWLNQNQMGALSLSNEPLQEEMLVTTAANQPISKMKVYKFALHNWRTTGARLLFVTKLADSETVVGEVRRGISGTSTITFGKLLETQGVVSDWLAVITGEAKLQPHILAAGDVAIEGRVPIQKSSILAGTAYILAQQLLSKR